MGYVGRFAPSPTGPLHAGSLVAALASWLDARAHGGQWLVRIEDTDTPRCIPGVAGLILRQLATCGLTPDEPPVYQSERGALYRTALDALIAQGRVYPCGCTRRDIELAMPVPPARGADLVYPGTCRHGLHGKPARAWRFRLPDSPELTWTDRRLGQQTQNLEQDVGDFVLLRADGLWSYQLAVVVDDARQGVTHVVRGEDLASNTPRQIALQHALQHALGAAVPSYMHTPLVLAQDGEKLSKQNGAKALDVSTPARAFDELQAAAQVLGLGRAGTDAALPQALASWVAQWASRWKSTA